MNLGKVTESKLCRFSKRATLIFRKILINKNENMPVNFSEAKIEKHQWKNFYSFNIFTQNIHCGYTPWREGSNEYLQCMLLIKNKKTRYTPANPSVSIRNWGG